MPARHTKRGPAAADRSKRSPVGWVAILYEYVDALIVAMVLLVLIFTFLVRIAGVQGNSMQPNLQTGDRLILSVHFYQPQYGDIVVINRYTEDPLVKRVIGLSGDRIRIDRDTGKVYRNGEVLVEPYLTVSTPPRDLTDEVTVPEGSLFVMGDNRTVSKDSRSREVGMIPESDVVGKAIWRIWPLPSFGALYDNLEK